METLVLDQSWQPHRVVSWQKAVHLLFDGKVEVLHEYDQDIRSVSLTIKMPAVVRLVRRLRRRHRPAVRFSRANVLARDRFTCQYCGTEASPRELTFDHVLPRAQGGRTTWENIVAACRRCNFRKGCRTPEQAGLTLRSVPTRPSYLPLLHLRLEMGSGVPDAWRSFLWWQSELQP